MEGSRAVSTKYHVDTPSEVEGERIERVLFQQYPLRMVARGTCFQKFTSRPSLADIGGWYLYAWPYVGSR